MSAMGWRSSGRELMSGEAGCEVTAQTLGLPDSYTPLEQCNHSNITHGILTSAKSWNSLE